MSLRNLRNSLLWGCVLVILILAAFLFEWRTAVISLTALPLSLLGQPWCFTGAAHDQHNGARGPGS